MIGPRLCAYACAHVDPVFTSQSYEIVKHKCKKDELASFSCAYTSTYVNPVFICFTHVLVLMLMRYRKPGFSI